MTMRPCAACRRHVREESTTCPFCGRPFVAHVVGERDGRLARLALAATLGLAAVGASCATRRPHLYGGPPPGGDDDDDVVGWTVELESGNEQTVAILKSAAVKHGCAINEENDVYFVARCPEGGVSFVLQGRSLSIACSKVNKDTCRRIVKGIVAEASSSPEVSASASASASAP